MRGSLEYDILSHCTGRKKLQILLLSDVHLRIDNIHQIKELMKGYIGGIDLVICPGDFTEISASEQNSDDMVSASEKSVKEILQIMEEIAPVIYVPGNHDPKTMFISDNVSSSHEFSLSSNSINVHSKTISLAPGLVLAGFGGSVAATLMGENKWAGYPYTEKDMFYGLNTLPLKMSSMYLDGLLLEEEDHDDDYDSKKVRKFLTSTTSDTSLHIKAPKTTSHDNNLSSIDDQLILLTHLGPCGVSTTEDWRTIGEYPEPIKTGSISLQKYLSTEVSQTNIIMNIHGHSHRGFGSANLGSIPIINPGTMRDGRYGVVTLEEDTVTRRWNLKSTLFTTL